MAFAARNCRKAACKTLQVLREKHQDSDMPFRFPPYGSILPLLLPAAAVPGLCLWSVPLAFIPVTKWNINHPPAGMPTPDSGTHTASPFLASSLTFCPSAFISPPHTPSIHSSSYVLTAFMLELYYCVCHTNVKTHSGMPLPHTKRCRKHHYGACVNTSRAAHAHTP